MLPGRFLAPGVAPGGAVTLLSPSPRPPVPPPRPQELVRLLQQTVRSSQYDKYFASSQLCKGLPEDTLELLHQKDDQILGLAGQLERFTLEKESLQQEVRALKGKVGELNEQLGMLMETIQAKDEVIMKLSRRLSECEGGPASPSGVPGSPGASPAGRDQLELDRLKVSAGRGPREAQCEGRAAESDGTRGQAVSSPRGASSETGSCPHALPGFPAAEASLPAHGGACSSTSPSWPAEGRLPTSSATRRSPAPPPAQGGPRGSSERA